MFEYDEGDGAQVAFLPLGGIKEDWTVAGDARQELVSRLHEVGEMAVKDGVVIGIRTPLDAGGDIKLLKEIDSKGIKIYYSFQNALENGRDLCKELNLKSATKPLNVLIAFTRPLITEFADNLNLKHPLLPTISPYPTM